MGFGIKKIFDFIPGYQSWRQRFAPGGGGIQHASIEVGDETEIHGTRKANMSLADARDFIRNTPFAQAVLNQLQIYCVGTVGGQLSFATEDEKFNTTANAMWARFAKHANFHDAKSVNKLLKDIVGCLFMNGGDCLLVFDDGQLTGGHGNGKVLAFESDQIANVPEEWFKREYGAKGYRQVRGVIKDRFDRPIGYFASAQRGLDEFPLKGGKPTWLTFIDESGECDPLKRNFFLVSRTWRPNQDRGISALEHVLTELRNLDELGASETESAKLNAHLGLAITSDGNGADAVAAMAAMTGEKVAPQKIKFDPMLRRQSAILQLPSGKKVESFKTDRPNQNVPAYIKQLQSNIVAVFGMGEQFFTLTPQGSFTAHRGAMQMAFETFRSIHCDLTDACNWLCSQWFFWHRRTVGDLAVTPKILETIEECADEWRWPQMPEVDNVSYQNATTAALNNSNLTLRKLHGPNWRKVVEEREIERQYCLAHGEPYPGDKMVSGGVIEVDSTDKDEKPKKEENNG